MSDSVEEEIIVMRKRKARLTTMLRPNSVSASLSTIDIFTKERQTFTMWKRFLGDFVLYFMERKLYLSGGFNPHN